MSDAPKLSGMKYLVESILSTDGNSTVMRIGDQGALGKPYALKILKREGPEDDYPIDLARAAAEASPKLGHPAILRYHDYRVKRTLLFQVSRAELLMEYVAGSSLDKIANLKVGPGILIFRQVAAALAHMHRRGVLHGDLTPANVLLSRTGQVKVAGYGLSLATARPQGKQGPLPRGTKPYQAPEQAKDDTLDEKTDLYNLGATMYHALTGKPPAARRPDGDVVKLTTPSAVNPKITPALNNLIVALLQAQPGKRPDDMFGVEQQLEAMAQEQGLDDESLKGLAAAPAG